MKKIGKDWKPFEIGLLLFSVIAICFSGVLCQSEILTIITSFVGTFCALLQAKGKIASQFIGIAEVILYSILSYPILSKSLLWGSDHLYFDCISHVCLWSGFLGYQ